MIEMPKSSQDTYKLIYGVVVDGRRIEDITLREMTGYEEDILANDNLPPMERFDRIIKQCVVSIGDITDRQQIAQIIDNMVVSDRVYLLILLRRATLGDIFRMEFTCPQCKKKFTATVDLSTLEIKRPAEYQDEVEVELPSGKKAILEVYRGATERQLARLSKADNVLSIAILGRLKQLNGTPIDKSPTGLEIVKSLSYRDRMFLRNKFEEMEGGVDTTLEVTCPECGYEFQSILDPAQRGFFFPQEI